MAKTKKKKKSLKETNDKICNMVNDKFIAHMQSIIDAVEKGGKPEWVKPWDCLASHSMPYNLISKNSYNGWNIWSLTIETMIRGYERNIWLTMKQASEAHEDFHEWKTTARGRKIAVDADGKMVKPIKLEELKKAVPVVFWKPLTITEKDKDGNEEKKKIFMLRYFQVYNVEQCQGIEHKLPAIKKIEREFSPIESAKAIAENMPNAPEISHGGDSACYMPSTDAIRMPKPEQFHTSENYYGTLFHELAHSTGHESRLDRDCFKTFDGFGSYSYGREELVAELTSAILCGEAGIIDTTMKDTVEYLKGWIKKIKEDSKILIFAASRAQKAANYIQGIEEKVYKDEEEEKEKVAVPA